jgi:hypothetical protein
LAKCAFCRTKISHEPVAGQPLLIHRSSISVESSISAHFLHQLAVQGRLSLYGMASYVESVG